MMQSGDPLCSICGDANAEVFVACHECNSPICRACFDEDVKEGRKVCLQCGTAYDGISFTWISIFMFSDALIYLLFLGRPRM